MTPLQFAKAECANYEADGACAGLGIRDDGSPYSFGRKPKCVLSLGQPCRYFEECILPMHTDTSKQEGMNLAKSREEATQIYRKGVQGGILKPKARLCPRCKYRELVPRHRVCYVCADKAKKEANRNRHKPAS